jgi:oxidase EvaA
MSGGNVMEHSDMHGIGSVELWLRDLRRRSDLSVEPVGFSQCEHWVFVEGALRHDKRRFFSVVGIRAKTDIPHLVDIEQPIILQPEIGILGFIVRKTEGGWEWLLQAKTEPGNTYGVQVGPSVQATVSNYMRIHGGLPTPMIELFVEKPPEGVQRLADIEQSEQGDRFLGKYNRNCVVVVPADYPLPKSRNWTWFPAGELRQALKCDFAINTDARSVMFCSDWNLLTDGGQAPFGRWRGTGGFGEGLLDSFETTNLHHTRQEILDFIRDKRESLSLSVEQVPVTELGSWQVSDHGISFAGDASPFSVKSYSVRTSDREVAAWHQPLFVGQRTVNITMICARVSGILHFLLRASAEIGFRETVQLGPSHIDDPAHSSIEWVDAALDDRETTTYACVMQSDEGGRFMHSVARYAIVEVPEKWTRSTDPLGIWLTLGQLQWLATLRGILTNETRSGLSLLLAYV